VFDNSFTWKRVAGEKPRALGVHLGHVPYIEPEGEDDRRGLRAAVALAVAVHVGLFLLHLPAGSEVDIGKAPERPVFVVKQVRFQSPPPRSQQQIPKRKERKKMIPIPDPTPDEPEPLLIEEVEIPEVDYGDPDSVYGIPEGPPGLGFGGEGPIRLGGDVTPPIKIHYPSPKYTEEGRQARIQGVVILEAIIDTMGNVASVKVLKGLPQGLTDSAVEAAKQWKFEPARRGGEPVAVFLNLTIRFSLQ
jgi:TonB family protein